jgi:hypothetical protein
MGVLYLKVILLTHMKSETLEILTIFGEYQFTKSVPPLKTKNLNETIISARTHQYI